MKHTGPWIIELGKYHGGNLSVQLRSPGSYEPYATLSVWVEGSKLAPDEFVVKNYSENAGLGDLSLYNGSFEDTGRRIDLSRFVKDQQIWRLAPATQDLTSSE